MSTFIWDGFVDAGSEVPARETVEGITSDSIQLSDATRHYFTLLRIEAALFPPETLVLIKITPIGPGEIQFIQIKADPSSIGTIIHETRKVQEFTFVLTMRNDVEPIPAGAFLNITLFVTEGLE